MPHYQPVISQDEPVTLARCPACQGSALYSIARYLDKSDRHELQRLEAAGYVIEETRLMQVTDLDECRCRPEEVARCRKARQTARTPKVSTRPILSLKSPRA